MDQGSLIWIQYMRFSRRAEGVNVSRRLFTHRARKWPRCAWQVSRPQFASQQTVLSEVLTAAFHLRVQRQDHVHLHVPRGRDGLLLCI